MMIFQELLPSHLLQNHVRFYHYSETRVGSLTLLKPLPARPEQFIQFSFQDPYTVIERASGKSEKAPPIVIVGRQTQRKADVIASGNVVTFTIHFQPTGFYHLFQIPLSEMTNLTLDGRDVIGTEVGLLYEQLCQVDSFQAMVDLAEAFLLKKMRNSHLIHPVQAAAIAILHQRGSTNLSALVSASHLSLRQFERSFTEQVGVPPKLFSRIVRFTHALECKHREPHRRWADIAYEAGYSDQMHLIRDCRAFAEETPSELVQNWVPCKR